VGTGAGEAVVPGVAPVELGDQQQPAVGRRIQVPGELGDAGLEFLLRQVGNATTGVFHDRAPRAGFMYSDAIATS
jgi:hypothetical protein